MGMVFCRGCGKEIHETALTCPNCGAQQNNLSSQTNSRGDVSPVKYYIEALKKYAVFNGRARRKEYWYFALFTTIIAVLLSLVGNVLGAGDILVGIYNLGVLVPTVAAAVRRLHDTNRSGWWFLLPIINLYFLVQDSQVGDNNYGPNPKLVTC